MRVSDIFYFAIIVFATISCTEELDTDFKGRSENFLVVEGGISTDTTRHIVRLSRTIDYTDTVAPPETGAIVTISDGEQTFVLTPESPGIYATDSNVYGEVGKEYRLDITTQDGKSYYATSTINNLTDIDSVVVKFERIPLIDLYFYIVQFNGQEPSGGGDHYRWNLYMNDTLYNDTLSESVFQSDQLVDGQYVKDMDLYWLLPEHVKSDTTLFTVEMVSLSEEHFTYLVEVMSETAWRGGPFDPTPANVSTNIIGDGVVGYFLASMKKRMSVLHIKTQEEKMLADYNDYSPPGF